MRTEAKGTLTTHLRGVNPSVETIRDFAQKGNLGTRYGKATVSSDYAL